MVKKILFIIVLASSTTAFAGEVKSQQEIMAAKKEMKTALKRRDQSAYAKALEKLNAADSRLQTAILRRERAAKPRRRLASTTGNKGIPAAKALTKRQAGCSFPRQKVPVCAPGDATCAELAIKLAAINVELDGHEEACRNKVATGAPPSKVEYTTNGATPSNDAPHEGGSSAPVTTGGAL